MSGEQRPPGLLYASLRIFDFSLSEMLWSRRTVFMGLVVGLPVFISAIIRLLYEMHFPGLRINQGTGGAFIFGVMIWVFFVHFSVPVLGVFYGTSLIADEVEDKTITYLFTRPIPRAAVIVGKYLAYLTCTTFVVLPSVVVVWLLIVPMGGRLGPNFLDLIKDLAFMVVGLAAYGAVFALVGAAVKRPLIAGLLFVFGWEVFVMILPGYLKRFSVAYYLQGLVPQPMPTDTPMAIMQSAFHDVPSIAQCLGASAAIIVVGLWLASRVVSRREYILEQ